MLKVSLYENTEHSVAECLREGNLFLMVTKCPSMEVASFGLLRGPTSLQWQYQPLCGSSSLSYSRAMFKRPLKTAGKSIGAILDLLKGLFDGVLASFCAKEQEARHRFKENMADLEAKLS